MWLQLVQLCRSPRPFLFSLLQPTPTTPRFRPPTSTPYTQVIKRGSAVHRSQRLPGVDQRRWPRVQARRSIEAVAGRSRAKRPPSLTRHTDKSHLLPLQPVDRLAATATAPAKRHHHRRRPRWPSAKRRTKKSRTWAQRKNGSCKSLCWPKANWRKAADPGTVR